MTQRRSPPVEAAKADGCNGSSDPDNGAQWPAPRGDFLAGAEQLAKFLENWRSKLTDEEERLLALPGGEVDILTFHKLTLLHTDGSEPDVRAEATASVKAIEGYQAERHAALLGARNAQRKAEAEAKHDQIVAYIRDNPRADQKKGLYLDAVAEAFGVSARTVRNALKAAGVTF